MGEFYVVFEVLSCIFFTIPLVLLFLMKFYFADQKRKNRGVAIGVVGGGIDRCQCHWWWSAMTENGRESPEVVGRKR